MRTLARGYAVPRNVTFVQRKEPCEQPCVIKTEWIVKP